jgi:hypothetical protein
MDYIQWQAIVKFIIKQIHRNYCRLRRWKYAYRRLILVVAISVQQRHAVTVLGFSVRETFNVRRTEAGIELHCSKIDLLPSFCDEPFRNQYYD